MIDRGGQVRREEDSFVCSLLFFCLLFFFLVPRRGYSSGVFYFLDETIGPKQERK